MRASPRRSSAARLRQMLHLCGVGRCCVCVQTWRSNRGGVPVTARGRNGTDACSTPWPRADPPRSGSQGLGNLVCVCVLPSRGKWQLARRVSPAAVNRASPAQLRTLRSVPPLGGLGCQLTVSGSHAPIFLFVHAMRASAHALHV